MLLTFKWKRVIVLLVSLAVIGIVLAKTLFLNKYYAAEKNGEGEKKHIKWVEMNVPYSLMEKALNVDINSKKEGRSISWIELMAYSAAKCGGNFKSFKGADLDGVVKRLESGENMNDIGQGLKLYPYFIEAYTAIFAEFVGDYKIQVIEDGKKVWKDKYGLKVFSPIAKGYGFSHYDDFGSGRSFGYRRKHLGNDLMGGIGTPIIAIESGTVEVMGWNIYGGWRVGIRSFDKKRYYYYAHLRKDVPFPHDMKEGQIVKAGDVIGYLGMTGYSRKENINNINVPHLHLGMQLIFDESQKDGINQIWIDVYNIVELLRKNKSEVVKNIHTKDFSRTYDIHDKAIPD